MKNLPCCLFAQEPSHLDICISFQSATSSCEIASRPAKFDFWTQLQSDPGQWLIGLRSLMFGGNFNQGPQSLTVTKRQALKACWPCRVVQARVERTSQSVRFLWGELGQRDMVSRPLKFDS